jgi:TolB protein
MERLTVRLATGAVAVACSLGPGAPAQASFPGDNGSIAYAAFANTSFDIYTVSSGGKHRKQLTKTGKINEISPAWSASGKKIAFARRDFSDPTHTGPFEVWVMNADGSHRHRLAKGTQPAWSPDGKKIAYVGPRQPRVGRPDIWVMNSDGSRQKQITSGKLSERSPDWSPNGKWIAYATDQGNSHDIWKMHPDGSHAVRLTAIGPYDDQPSWAPSGKKIAYVSRDALGFFHIWTMQADGTGATQVGDAIAYNIAWAPDGGKIAFDSGGTQAGTEGIFRVGLSGANPVRLTTGPSDSEPSWRPA